jgi:DNA-binding response OmpR family regulator
MQKRVMIIDDDKEFLDELQEILNLSGYDTEVFSDGETALKMVNEVKPDIILLDLKMSGKSGLQVADELSHLSETAHIPIVAVTAYYTQKEHTMLMNICGIKRRLIKPFNPLDVINTIEAVLKENRR